LSHLIRGREFNICQIENDVLPGGCASVDGSERWLFYIGDVELSEQEWASLIAYNIGDPAVEVLAPTPVFRMRTISPGNLPPCSPVPRAPVCWTATARNVDRSATWPPNSPACALVGCGTRQRGTAPDLVHPLALTLGYQYGNGALVPHGSYSDIRWRRPFRLARMRICVFCGSKAGARPDYVKAARDLGRFLAERDITLVYGGASVGTMGELADAALAAGGAVIGVIPQSLVDHEIAHRALTDIRIVGTMHERKALMAELSDGFIALPGAAGTLEELHAKPCGLLDVAGYYQQLGGFLDHMVGEDFLVPEHRRMLTVRSDPARLLEDFAAYRPPRQKYAGAANPRAAVDSLAWLHIQDRRLLTVRTRGKQLFYLPGGKREPGESDVQALTREISEELGVALRPDSLRFRAEITAIADGFDDGRQVHMVCYSADHAGIPAAGREIEELAWIATADADRCPPAGRRVLDLLHADNLID
jgi:hypothetical protein